VITVTEMDTPKTDVGYFIHISNLLRTAQNKPNMVSHSDSGDVQSKLEQLSKQMEFLMKKCAAGGESSHNSSSGEASNIA
jgi:hypothetical protein